MPTRVPSSPTRLPGPTAAQGRSSPGPIRLLDQLRTALRSRHYSRRTERAYCLWVRRFIRFHDLRHPADMAEPEINAFLTHLAVTDKVSASTQNQALSALLFLYRHVVGRQVGELQGVVRARVPSHVPVVLTRTRCAPSWRTSTANLACWLH